jgi:hypothetical protein
MSQGIKFSPRDRDKMIRLAAEIVAEKVLGLVDDPADLVLLPVPTVAALANLSRPTIGKKMPVVKLSAQQQAVRLSDFQRYIDANTTTPAHLTPRNDDGQHIPPLSVVNSLSQ